MHYLEWYFSYGYINAKSTPSSRKQNQDASGNSPNANKEKNKKGDISICPICTEIIVEQTKTKKDMMLRDCVKPGYIDDVQAYLPSFLMS